MSFEVFFSAKTFQSCEQISFQLVSKSGSGKAELWVKRPFEDGNHVVSYLSMTPCCKAGQVDSHFPPTGPRAGKLVPPFGVYIPSTLRVRINRKFSRWHNAKQFQKWKKGAQHTIMRLIIWKGKFWWSLCSNCVLRRRRRHRISLVV